jgi:hypothetical protein
LKKMLFVDGEPRVLQGLQRMLHAMRGKWDMEFVDSGAQAMQRMERQPYQVGGMDYLETVGVADRVGDWRGVCRKLVEQGGAHGWTGPA